MNTHSVIPDKLQLFLEVRGKIIRTVLVVLCTDAVHSHKHTYEFLQFSGLGFVTLGPFHCA